MLGITRKQGEAVVLSQDGKTLATITIKEARSGRIRILFDCPNDVRVVRAELLRKEAK